MTSLSRPKKRDVTIELPMDDPAIDFTARLPDPDTKPEDIVYIKIFDKEYPFTKAMIAKHPKLLDPDCLFLLNFESVLPLLYGYPPSCIRGDLLDEDSEKQTFLCNLEFLEIELTESMILHLCRHMRQEVQEASDLVKRHTGPKGKRKIRIDQDTEVVTFACQQDQAFREAGANIMPMELLRYLSTGAESLLNAIVIADFKSKNLIGRFIKSFLGFLGT